MFDRILYAVERGGRQPRSLEYVRDIALHHDSEVIVLRVGELKEDQLALAKKYTPDIEGATVEAEAEARVEGQLTAFDVAEALTNAGVFARTLSRAGRIGEEVLKAADETEADLLIVGSAPRTAIGAFLSGNVTDEIVRRSNRPVLVIPNG